MSAFARTVVRNSAAGFIAQFAMRVLSFGFNVLVIRQLGAEAFGQYMAIGAFGELFLFIADLGLAPYAVREFARVRELPDAQDRARALFGNLLWLRIALAFVSGACTVAAGVITQRPVEVIVALTVNALFLWVYGIQGASDVTLSGFERLDLSAGAKVLNQLIFVVAGGAALALGAGYFGLIGANLLGGIAMAVVCWRGVRRLGVSPAPPQLADWPRLLRAALPFGLVTFALGLSYRFDTVLLDIWQGDIITGHYRAAYNLIFSLVMISNVINTALYPTLTRQAARHPERVADITTRILRYLLSAAIPLAVGGFLLAGPLVDVLYRAAEYGDSVQALQILIWVLPFMYASEFLGYVILITNRERLVARAVIVSTCVNVILNLILVPRYGLLAASAMTVITEVVLVSQHVWNLRPLSQQIDWGRSLLRPLGAAIVMGVVIAVLTPWLPWWSLIPVGILTYGLAGFLLGAFGFADLAFLRRSRSASVEA